MAGSEESPAEDRTHDDQSPGRRRTSSQEKSEILAVAGKETQDKYKFGLRGIGQDRTGKTASQEGAEDSQEGAKKNCVAPLIAQTTKNTSTTRFPCYC